MLKLRQKIDSMPVGEDHGYTFRMAAALHSIILSKEMSKVNPGWDTEDAIQHSGNVEWGYSGSEQIGMTTLMRHGVLLFSSNGNIKFTNSNIHNIASVIKPFSDVKNLKTVIAIYQLTVESEDKYTSIKELCESTMLSESIICQSIENEISRFIIKNVNNPSQFRLDSKYMKLIPILSMVDFI